MIIRAAERRCKKGKSVLIIVTEIEHGKNLLNVESKLKIEFIRGSTSGKKRDLIKKDFIDKKVKCVIATAVWVAGVDIPTLDCIILAGVGKSETKTVQIVGRATRKTEIKDKFEIIDFLDPYRYLAEHTIGRLIAMKREKIF